MTTFDYSRLESDLAVLRMVRGIIASATASARIAGRPRLNPDVCATTDIGIAVEHLDAAMDSIDDAIATIAPHMPGFTPPSAEMDEPHGSRDTFVPHPLPECPACGNSLRFDEECRCAGCGNG